jgi:hypothetical protein
VPFASEELPRCSAFARVTTIGAHEENQLVGIVDARIVELTRTDRVLEQQQTVVAAPFTELPRTSERTAVIGRASTHMTRCSGECSRSTVTLVTRFGPVARRFGSSNWANIDSLRNDGQPSVRLPLRTTKMSPDTRPANYECRRSSVVVSGRARTYRARGHSPEGQVGALVARTPARTRNVVEPVAAFFATPGELVDHARGQRVLQGDEIEAAIAVLMRDLVRATPEYRLNERIVALVRVHNGAKRFPARLIASMPSNAY